MFHFIVYQKSIIKISLKNIFSNFIVFDRLGRSIILDNDQGTLEINT